jgi:hypothetical protein
MRRRTAALTLLTGAALVAAAVATSPASAALRSTARTHTGTHRLALGLACPPKNFRCKGLLDPFRFDRVSPRVPKLAVRVGEHIRFRLPFRPASASITLYARGSRLVSRVAVHPARTFSWTAAAAYRRDLRHGGLILVITTVTNDAHRYGYAARFVKA